MCGQSRPPQGRAIEERLDSLLRLEGRERKGLV